MNIISAATTPTWRPDGVRVVAVYCDGGVLHQNPSTLGGTAAWRALDGEGAVVYEWAGVLPAPPGGAVSNNLMEWIAAILALEAMPSYWSGCLYTDSNVTRGRLVDGWALRALPPEWTRKGFAALARLTWNERRTFAAVLVGGHPSPTEVLQGYDRRGLPVSEHNVWCDAACGQAGREYLARLREAAEVREATARLDTRRGSSVY